MASRIGDIIVDCHDPELLASFWSAVLGYRVFARDETGVAIRGATVSPDILSASERNARASPAAAAGSSWRTRRATSSA